MACNGEFYLFLEHEYGQHVDRCVVKVERRSSSANVVGNWKNILKEFKTSDHGLLVYLEFSMCTFMAMEKFASSTPLNIKE